MYLPGQEALRAANAGALILTPIMYNYMSSMTYDSKSKIQEDGDHFWRPMRQCVSNRLAQVVKAHSPTLNGLDNGCKIVIKQQDVRSLQ